MKIERKSFKAHIKAIENRTVTQVFSVFDVIDVYQERVKPGAFKKTISERLDRIKVLWQHNYFLPPVATLDAAREIGRESIPDEILEKFPTASGALEADVTYLNTERGEEILAGIEGGAITENSIGFDIIQEKRTEIEVEGSKIKVRDLIELRLWDLSPVNWGANPATFNQKLAVPFESTGVVPSTQLSTFISAFTQKEWDDLPEEEKYRIAKHYAWSEIPVVPDGLKLPHHQPARVGIGPASEGGVRQSMNTLLRAEIDINQKEEVHDHLSRHFFEFGEKSPPYKLVELAYSVRDSLTLGEENLESCFEELQALNAKLREVEPVIDPSVITHFEIDKARVRSLMHYVDSV
jgi:phage head maturation protease